jgi:RNA polymerase sigma-70 factor, ECF subfamily
MPLLAASFLRLSPRDWSETELLGHVLRHDARAWTELVRRYRPVVFRCISKILGRSNIMTAIDVEEVYGELLANLVRDDMRKLRLWDPARGAKLGSWIGLLAKNAAHDYLRVHTSRPIADHDIDRAAEVDGAGNSPLDDVLLSERRERLEGMLAEYSDKDRAFFDLYFSRGMTVEEIAVEMGISVKTVYTKKHKLLTRLASTMAA